MILVDILTLFGGVSYLEMALIVLSIAGQELITKRNKNGFYFWIVANSCGMVLFYSDDRGLMILLYAYYFLKCVQGMLNWKRLDAKENETSAEIIRLRSRIAELDQTVDFESSDEIESRNVLKKIVSDLAYAQLLSSEKNGILNNDIPEFRGFPFDDERRGSDSIRPCDKSLSSNSTSSAGFTIASGGGA